MFAPSDEAFDNVPEAELDALLSNKKQLTGTNISITFSFPLRTTKISTVLILFYSFNFPISNGLSSFVILATLSKITVVYCFNFTFCWFFPSNFHILFVKLHQKFIKSFRKLKFYVLFLKMSLGKILVLINKSYWETNWTFKRQIDVKCLKVGRSNATTHSVFTGE